MKKNKKKSTQISTPAFFVAVLTTLIVTGLAVSGWSYMANENLVLRYEQTAKITEMQGRAVLGSTDSLDQGGSCPTGGAIGANFGVFPSAYQTFVPTLNRLSKVVIPVSYEGLLPQQTYTLRVFNGATQITTKQVTVNASQGNITVTFDFTDVAVTPGATYKLMLSSSDTNAGSDWIATMEDCVNGSSYSQWSGLSPQDYSFKTYGWNYVPPAAPAATTQPTTAQKTTPTTTAAPAATTPETATAPTTTSTPTVTETKQTEPTAKTPESNQELKKKTLIESVQSKPVYFYGFLGGLVVLLAGFLALYELKLKTKK